MIRTISFNYQKEPNNEAPSYLLNQIEASLSHNATTMCIHYTIEFWTPHPTPSAEIERRVLRGIEQPGRNRAAKQKEFWLHENQYFSRSQCLAADIREGGVYYNRIFEFCFDDVDCRARLEQFEAEYNRWKRDSQRAESRLESPEWQRHLAQQWLRAYNDWVSAYENHKDCPQTRNRHQHFSALQRAGVCIGVFGLPDKLRLGVNPNTVQMPSVGIERGGAPVPRR